MAKKTNQPNIFIVLEMDPTKRWNQAEFEKQLQSKRREWSRLVPEGEYVRWLTIEEIEEEKAEAHLEMLDEICCIPKPRFIGRSFVFAACRPS